MNSRRNFSRQKKKRPQLETRKLQMGKLTGKGKHTVKVGEHPHTNMISKLPIVRRGKHKCRILEIHLKLKDQQLKTIFFIYKLLYQNLKVTRNQSSTVDTNKKVKRKRNPNTTLKLVVNSQEKRTKEEGKKKTYKNKSKTANKISTRTYIWKSTLSIDGSNDPTKRHRLAEWIQK